MLPHEKNWVRLPLRGAHNVRELGGYPTSEGGQTSYHRFLRADGLYGLDERDRRFLHDYGVRAVIDLRGTAEVAAMPDVRIGDDVVYRNISLLDFNAASYADLEARISAGTFRIEYVYGLILENFEAIRSCLQFMAGAPVGCILFHCAVGKDRTGILAMLLMALAGADKWDVVGNYVQSFPNLMRDEAYKVDYHDEMRVAMARNLESTPDMIAYAWDRIDREFGGARAYLTACGVSEADIDSVRLRLLS